ncbi:MAG: L,D-transpeptidase family protein [Pseudomonadota bacterium]
MRLINNLNKFSILFLVALTFHISVSKASQNLLQDDHAEQELIQIIDLIQAQKTDIALSKSSRLLEKFPNFKLLSAVRADILYSHHHELNEPLNLIKDQQQQQNFISEASARLDSVSDSVQLHQQHIPDLLKYIDSSTAYAFIIDFSKSRLYLFKNTPNNPPELIVDHYLTIGKEGYNKQVVGDKKTPLGIYHITSFLADKQLPELYGWGAFPINYPNAWDKKMHRTGSGIWLHGVPRDTYSRPPLDSRGCMVISNNFLINLAPYLKINTPVILTQSINWVDKSNFIKQSKTYKNAFNTWKNAWQSKDINKYLNFYSKDFNNNKKDYRAWNKHKRRIFNKTKQIKLKIEQLTVLTYPGEKDLLSVSFYQHYTGDRYRSKGFKQQYWKLEDDGIWRIIYEFSA